MRDKGVKVTFDRSKTDQGAGGASLGIRRKEESGVVSSMCCAKALEQRNEEWKKTVQGKDDDLVLRALSRKGLLTDKPFTQKRGAKEVKEAIEAIGEDLARYSTHSARINFGVCEREEETARSSDGPVATHLVASSVDVRA